MVNRPLRAEAPDERNSPRLNANAARPINFKPDGPGVKRLKRRAVITVVAVVATGTLFAVGNALKPAASPEPSEREAGTPAPQPSDVVTGMPASYDGLARGTPKLGPSKNGEFGSTELAYDRNLRAAPTLQPGSQRAAANPQPSAEERELEHQNVERLKREGQARQAGTQFASGAASGGPAPYPGDEVLRQRLAELQRLQQGAPGQPGVAPIFAAGAERDASNRQDDKTDFLSRPRGTEAVLQQRVVAAPAGPVIGAGTVIPGVFLTGINSDLPGQITGQVSQNVYDSVTGTQLLIPQGAMLIGEYDAKVTYGQQRVLLVWNRIRLPNGSSISLEGMPGVDLSGYAGASDQVNNHWLKLTTGVIFGSLLGAGTQVAQGSTSTANPSFGQLAAQGAGQSVNQAGQDLTRKNLGIQPTLEIRPGMRFNVFVTKDIGMPAYQP